MLVQTNSFSEKKGDSTKGQASEGKFIEVGIVSVKVWFALNAVLSVISKRKLLLGSFLSP